VVLKSDDDIEQAEQRYLSSFAYTIDGHKWPVVDQMWTADDFITTGPDGKERPWQSLILVTGNDTAFAQLSADVLRRTGQNLPILWHWDGWRNEPPHQPGQNCSETPWGECWTGCPDTGPPYPCAGGEGPQPAGSSCNACGCNEHNTSCSGKGRQPYEGGRTLKQFQLRYGQLRAQFPHLAAAPFGVYFGDEPDLARNPELIPMLSKGLEMVKQQWPTAVTYLNMLYASVGCPGPNPGGPFLCNASTWSGDPTALAVALGKMPLDWMSTDEYYDVTTQHYQAVYRERLYPHLRPEQRVVLLPFAAYCEIGCHPNTSIVGADPHCLAKAQEHLAWAESDSRVIGLFIYRLKDLWQKADMAQLDACENPWGMGLGLVDRCGVGGSGGYAMPETLAFYQQNVSVLLST
jgi:hypothetical protein